jgi:hypothetical protein
VLAGLENFLISHGLPYRRHSDGKYEYDPVVADYRPDLGWIAPKVWPANTSGETVVPVSSLRDVCEMLTEAAGMHNDAERLALIQIASAKLDQRLPPPLPPLPPFEIVGELPTQHFQPTAALVEQAEPPAEIPPEPLKRATDLAREELEAVVESLQQSLYLDTMANGELAWNPDKEWDGADVCQDLACLLRKYGLAPSGQDYSPLERNCTPRRFVLYDPDSGELLGGLYDTYGQAVTYANMISDVLVLAIEIPGLPENEGDDEALDGDGQELEV